MSTYLKEFKSSADLTTPTWNVCIDAFLADTESAAHQTRSAVPVPKERRAFAGTPLQFEAHLAQVRKTYQTKNLVLSTLWASNDIEAQVRSFTLAAEVAGNAR